MIFLLKNWKLVAMLGVAAALSAVVVYYGKTRYDAGVRNTTAAFVAADKKGASNVRETARETLNDIGDDVDLDELLGETGGLRD